MKFKELFDRTILTENHVRKELKIYYEIDFNLIKPIKEAGNNQETDQNSSQPQGLNQQVQTPDTSTQVAPVADTGAIQEPTTEPAPEQSSIPASLDPNTTEPITMPANLASVVTEDEVSENSNDKIVRKFEGELSLSDGQKDNIQSFEDIVSLLGETKKDGVELLDEFSLEMVNLCLTQNFNELKNKLDKKSKIFLEIYYGFKKDDSIGIRFNKRANSDTLTSTLLVDNEIVATTFSLDKANKRVAEYRNYEVKK